MTKIAEQAQIAWRRFAREDRAKPIPPDAVYIIASRDAILVREARPVWFDSGEFTPLEFASRYEIDPEISEEHPSGFELIVSLLHYGRLVCTVQHINWNVSVRVLCADPLELANVTARLKSGALQEVKQ